jgi:hypothetical protein
MHRFEHSRKNKGEVRNLHLQIACKKGEQTGGQAQPFVQTKIEHLELRSAEAAGSNEVQTEVKPFAFLPLKPKKSLPLFAVKSF